MASTEGLKAPWKPGESGNPGGRPSLPDWFKAAGPDALRFLMQVAAGDEGDAKVSRAEACLKVIERCYGAVPKAIELPSASDLEPVVAAVVALAKRKTEGAEGG